MEFFTLRNTAIMGLVQVGLVVAAVLGAGAVFKWYVSIGLSPPRATALVAEYGYLGLVLPVAWIALALHGLYRGEPSGPNPWIPVLFGVPLLLLGLYGTWVAVVGPFLRSFGCGFTLGH